MSRSSAVTEKKTIYMTPVQKEFYEAMYQEAVKAGLQRDKDGTIIATETEMNEISERAFHRLNSSSQNELQQIMRANIEADLSALETATLAVIEQEGWTDDFVPTEKDFERIRYKAMQRLDLFTRKRLSRLYLASEENLDAI